MMTRTIPAVAVLAAQLTFAPPSAAQNTGAEPPPVIDVHFHAILETREGAPPMCPNQSAFLASDPQDGPEAPFGWSEEDCTPKLYPAPPGKYLEMITEEMKRLNVTAVVFGSPEAVAAYEKAAPGRVIPGNSFAMGTTVDKTAELRRLEMLFTEGGFRVMGEIGLQYQGMSPSDMSVDDYFALAERLDVPVAIHMGTGGSGRANVSMPSFRASMGDPLLLEEVLARHPKLRVQIMHAGYPMIDNTLALLQANSHVYVDIAGLIWSYPIYEVNRYIERLVRGGFGDRVMFGTDQLTWPGLMAHSISIVQNADYLTSEQKRDILYNNAARFLRIEKMAHQ
jgi:predicted TIM-barrel fold metal-dependent hydrolase